MRTIRRSRWLLKDPVSVGFQMLIQTERRLAQRRTFKVKLRIGAMLALIAVANVGALVGLMALLTWMQGTA